MNEQQLYHTAIAENLAPAGRVYENVLRAAHPRRRIARRAILAAAACLVLAAAAVACIPEARAAVLNWLRPAADPAHYLATPAAERESVPALDAAIGPVGTDGLAFAVTAAADDAWRSWAEALSVRPGEVLYDGETVYLSGTLYGNTGDLIKPASAYVVSTDAGVTTLAPPDDLVVCSARFALGGQPMQETRRSALPLSDDGENAARIAAGALPFTLDLPVGSGLTGRQSLTVELIFADAAAIRAANAAPGAEGVFPVQAALRISGLTFDPGPANAANAALPVPAPAALSGDVLVFSGEEPAAPGRAMVGNDRLSVGGGTFSVLRMRQQLTGTEITLCLTLPSGWTARQCAAVSDRVSVELVADGENQGGFGQSYASIRYFDSAEALTALGLSAAPDAADPHNIVFCIETGLSADDWQRLHSLHLLLCIDELTDYNHSALPENGRVEVAAEPDGWSETTAVRRFAECPLVLK